MSKTKRMQNKCKDCKYTWYPRGKDLSMKCPNCGSRNIGFSGNWIFLILVVFLGFIAIGTYTKETTPPPENSITESAVIPTEIPATHSSTPSIQKAIASNEPFTSENKISVQPLPMAENERVVTEGELKLSKKVLAESLLALQACGDSTDDESKSHCIALQCAKAELAPTPACMDRQANE